MKRWFSCDAPKKNNELDSTLWLWFMQECWRGSPISRPILKGMQFYTQNFKVLVYSWQVMDGYHGRKKCHEADLIGICGEKLSVDPSAASNFPKNWHC